jgi:murein tripeptide amidase MpaA
VSYLNVVEVETALALAARPENAAFTELVPLPRHTWEGRACSAVRVHEGPPARAGVYLLGGVHAREWGSPDILVNLVHLLTDAYRTSTGITQGGASTSADDVRRIVQTLDVVVFPQANPDGRHHSMTVDPMWRKNRRPAAPGSPPCPRGGGRGPGVDVNRNYDFLWDFPTAFSPQAPVATSTHPCDEVYRGPGAASEPETVNVTWLLDRFPSVTHFVDVHSFGEDVLYNWGDDDDQTTDPAMNFRNPAYDGRRGIPDSTPGGDEGRYREYLPAADLQEAIALGTVMRDAIRAAHGREYSVKSAVGLYPTSGTSDDWAYSRHFADRSKGRVLGYTIEWGPQRASIPKSFHPAYPDMVPIIEEVTAALLALCVAVADRAAAPGEGSAGGSAGEPTTALRAPGDRTRSAEEHRDVRWARPG